MQGKLELHKHVDFASNRVTIDVIVLIEKPMIEGADVLHEHLIVLFYILLFTSCGPRILAHAFPTRMASSIFI